MERRKLTREDVEKAETYLPLAKKYALAQVLAPGCVETLENVPPMWQENIIGRKLVELYVLTGFYLPITDVSGLDREVPEFVFSLEDYDRLSHIPYELDDEEILRDFKEFQWILDKEVQSILNRKNDVLSRLQELADMGMDPEAFQQLQKELEAAKRAGEEV